MISSERYKGGLSDFFIGKSHEDYNSIYSIFCNYNSLIQHKTSLYDLTQDFSSTSDDKVLQKSDQFTGTGCGAREGIVDSHTCLFINPDQIDIETIQNFFDSDDEEFVIEHYYVFQVSLSI